MIGRRRERIEILEPVEVDLPGGSGKTEWVSIGFFWAESVPQRQQWTLQDEQIQSYTNKVMRIRYNPNFTPGKNHMVIHNGIRYTLNSVVNIDDRERKWELNLSTIDQPVS